MEILYNLLIAVLLAFGAWRVSAGVLYHDKYTTGKKNLQQIGKWYKEKQEFWDNSLFKKATRFLTRFVYLADTARDSLKRHGSYPRAIHSSEVCGYCWRRCCRLALCLVPVLVWYHLLRAYLCLWNHAPA